MLDAESSLGQKTHIHTGRWTPDGRPSRGYPNTVTILSPLKSLAVLLLIPALNAAARPIPAPMPPSPEPALHSSDWSVEEKLRVWLSGQKFDSKPKAVLPAEDMSDLKDAVASPAPPPEIRDDILRAQGAQRQQLAERLPGMAAEPFDFCRDLEHCTRARTSFHVDDESLVRDAVAAVVRPWIILEKARGDALAFEPVEGAGDKILDLKLKSLPNAALGVHVEPVSTGGYDVWLTGSSNPGDLFRHARQDVLPPSSN